MIRLPILIAVLSLAPPAPVTGQTVRVATFNIWELTEQKLTQTNADGVGTNAQLKGAAEIIQRVRPDILLINEIDVGNGSTASAKRFSQRYLTEPQGDQKLIAYPHLFTDEVNTGMPSGFDLDNNGRVGGPGDAWGYGKYVGQYGMMVLSRFPIDRKSIRTFRSLRWIELPNALIPDGTGNKPNWFSPEEAEQMPLSSKSHWDVPVQVGNATLHLLCSHPTPPVFDGPEDRNGRRNFDEIRLWADYISGGKQAGYIVDDQDRRGPISPTASFVVLGDLNADPRKDPAPYGQPAIQQLLAHTRIKDYSPKHENGDGTCEFGRIDYVLPSSDLKVSGCGVFSPPANDPLHWLIESRTASSDHRLVWIDVQLSTK